MTVQVVRATMRSSDEVGLELELTRLPRGLFYPEPEAKDFPMDFLVEIVNWATEGMSGRRNLDD